MTTRTTTIANTYTTDVQFRAFVAMMHNNFAATSMVQTTDTGQINPATVIKPTVTNTVAGYEIWRFNDALQATAPLFIKVEYGVGAGVTGVQMWLTVGTGSDGAGNLTYAGWPGASAVIPRRSMVQGSTGTTTGPVYFTYLADGSWALLMWPSNAVDNAGVIYYSVERFRNADGTANGDGVITLYASGYSTSSSLVGCDARYYAAGAVQPTTAALAWQTVYTVNTQGSPGCVLGNTLYPVPVFTGLAPRIAAPSQFVLALGQSDLAAGLSFQLAHYGTTITWISAGPGSTAGLGNLGGPSAYYKSLAFRTD